MIRNCISKIPEEVKFIQYDGTNHSEVKCEWGWDIGGDINDDKTFLVKDSAGQVLYCEVGDYIVEYNGGVNLYSEIDFNKQFSIKD